MPSPHVVIAGAGPNGLMLSCELAIAGVHSVVLDPQPGPGAEPKANGLAGQVVQMLDMRGLYHAFGGADGPPVPIREWMFAGMPIALSGVEHNPMHALMIQQPRLVRLLEKHARELGVDVRWGHALRGLTQDGGGVTIAVDAPGDAYDLETAYLVGADGGRSLVRKTVGIAFPGSTSDTVTRLADVQLPEALRGADGGFEIPGFGPLRHRHNRLDRGGYIFFEMPGGRTIFATIEPGRLGADAPPMSLEDLRESARRVFGADVPLELPQGPGPHAMRRMDGTNTRLAQNYRVGNVFLLGDAAHVHSPMGGPGLNLGLQDTVNLGWKLAATIKGWAPEGLLDTYESERRPVGERVMMQSLAQQALMAPGPEVTALRALLGELFDESQVRNHMAHLLAGSDVRYPIGDPHPLSGYLAPELTLDDGTRLAELLRDARPLLLDLSGGGFAARAGAWADRVDLVTGGSADTSAAALLVRPDGYVAWATDSPDGPGLPEALARWFGPA
ncbi:FAD-dependent oxidoreductase [Mycolicibacterium sp. P1-18]|uniref:FAD-dependent monooxygenase n=1 Tax=Mycolicibacterium sp. P1-18 TaxID=2024615 RepID=UPI0011F24EEB|nr:FAD-dependent monooxygenase [Mycolicibacterium sp. P1-18]KAA0098524.1 FAD-dependent oxidoreductase [Mycolicibacterium sp. P1-18]